MLAHQLLVKIQFAFLFNSIRVFFPWWRFPPLRVSLKFQLRAPTPALPPIRVLHAGAPAAANEIQFAFLSNSNSMSFIMPAHQLCARYNSLRLKIHFAFPSNSNLRTSTCMRYYSRSPPIRVLHHAGALHPARDTKIQFAFPPISIRILHSSAPAPARDKIRVFLQIQLIRAPVPARFAFPSNSSSS